MTFSSNQLYVGTGEGIILVYQNEKLINKLGGCDGRSAGVRSTLFDSKGYMATACYCYKLYLCSQNGSFTCQNLRTPFVTYFIGFDSTGQFILISEKQINVIN